MRLGIVAMILAALGLGLYFGVSDSGRPAPVRTAAPAVVAPASPPVIQCEVTNPRHPTTLWLGYPSTLGKLYTEGCQMHFSVGSGLTLTLAGTRVHTSYKPVLFSPAHPPTGYKSLPAIMGDTHVTLMMVDDSALITPGGPDRIIGAVMEYPKSLGTVMLVQIGGLTYPFALQLMGSYQS